MLIAGTKPGDRWYRERLLLKHGRQELERACAKALSYSPRPSYKTIKSIIAKSAEPSGEDPDVGAYLRGSDYYTTLESKGDVR